MIEIRKVHGATVLLNVPSASLPKIAILMFYLRLNPEPSFRYDTMIVLALTWSYLISFELTQMFGCSPPQKLWKPRIPGKYTYSSAIVLLLTFATGLSYSLGQRVV